MRFYNTLTRKLEEFKPIENGKVGVYSCGPTVYWFQHIGHLYAYVQWDTMVRYFRWLGLETKWVMNITDVGHLTSDADTGEDKMEKGAKREGVSVWQVADKYIAQFKNSLELLNIRLPDVLCRATENIPLQIELIKRIEKNGFTYLTKKGLVFDTSKYGDYSKFANIDLCKQKIGCRAEVEVDPDKKQPCDFFLWVIDSHHLMKWKSPWGEGYPGWHIECTAMSTHYLGELFDIHTGGIEHIGVHHTNEIAQGYGAFGHQTANYWLHNAWLVGKGGEKMSKSLGNFVTVQQLLEQGGEPMALRYLILTSNYRSGLEYSASGLTAAGEAWKKLKNQIAELRGSGLTRTVLSEEKLRHIDKLQNGFKSAIEDNLNYAKALAVVWETIKSNIPPQDKYDLVVDFDEVLGLKLTETRIDTVTPESVVQLQKLRDSARSKGDWEKADQLRQEINKMGWQVEDSAQGSRLMLK